MSSGGLLESFLAAFQASLSVILIIFYGVLASQFNLLDKSAGKAISKVCVRMFLPALLITKVGSELHLDTATRYLPILIWAFAYTLLSLALGMVATKLLKFPPWVTPAVCFNNTTSLPLLLVQSLGATGVLDRLILGDEKASDAIERAKSYFLVCAIVGNCLTFAIGPKLLDAEHAPGHPKEDQPDVGYHQANGQHENVENDNANEQTSLLPNSIRRNIDEVEDREHRWGKKHWNKLSPRTQNLLDLVYAFFNSALIGAIMGATIGLAPPLHRAFFNSSEEGGFLNAWLTSSLSDIGELFVSLQVVVVGVSLGEALRKMKRGEASGAIPWIPSLFVLVVRFILWPVISIALIWVIASKTRLLGDDPILWFAMMLMPTGPTAMKLVAMADCNDADEDEKMSISKFLVVSYVMVPFLSFAVVASLKASEMAMDSM